MLAYLKGDIVEQLFSPKLMLKLYACKYAIDFNTIFISNCLLS